MVCQYSLSNTFAEGIQFSKRSPIDLSLLAGQNRQAKECLSGDRAKLSHRPSQLKDVSLISTVAQHLEKARGSQSWMLFESLLNEIQKRIRRKRFGVTRPEALGLQSALDGIRM